MNTLFRSLMADATHLTRTGHLQAATEAIQRALGNATPSATSNGTSQAANGGGSTARKEGIVLDGLTRVVNEARQQNFADADTAVDSHKSADRASPLHQEQWLDAQFTHQGRTLRYRLYLPPTTSTISAAPPPLVMMLHGCTQDAADFATGTQMNALARDQGMAVLYPEQAPRANAQKCWNWFKPQHQQRGRGEPAFLVALAQSVAEQHGLDRQRMYVAGLSAGGAMADILGRCYPDVFAAVGVHSGLPAGAATDVVTALSVMRSGASTSTSIPQQNSHLPPTIVFHGDADSTVHIRNAEEIVKTARASQQHTSEKAASTQTHAGRSIGGQSYTRQVNADAAGKSHTEYWQLHGAGHAWSGGSPKGSYTDARGVDASAEMLRFFTAHSLPKQ